MLETVEWGEFKIGDLFEIQNTLSFNKDKLVEGSEYDYVTRTSQNQGILQQTGFVNEQNINPAGVWSLGLLQMDFFYRHKPWYAGQFVRKLIPKLELTKSSILYFTALLNKQKEKLLTVLVRNVDNILLNTKIQLPVKNGKIDFEFIESFIAELETQRIAELEAYLEVTNLKDYHLTSQEQQVLADFESGKVIFDAFKIGDLFEIATGRDVIIGRTLKGSIPLVSHQHENNGITKRIAQLSNRKLFNYQDTLPLADRGVFLATTQNTNFHIGTRVKALTFKNGKNDIKKRLFFVSTINKLQKFFLEYSSNATGNLPNLSILLPTKNNKPNYEIMETLISAVQKLVIKDVVLYADRKIKVTREVVDLDTTVKP